MNYTQCFSININNKTLTTTLLEGPLDLNFSYARSFDFAENAAYETRAARRAARSSELIQGP